MSQSARPGVADLEVALELLEACQMPWTFRVAAEREIFEPVWNGERLNVITATGSNILPSMDGSDVIHELAHWCVASHADRPRENYGCGPDVLARGSHHAVCDDEIHAALLDIYTHSLLGLDWQAKARFYSFDNPRHRTWPQFFNRESEYNRFRINLVDELGVIERVCAGHRWIAR